MKKILSLILVFVVLGSASVFAGDFVAGFRLGAGHGGQLGKDKPNNQMFALGAGVGAFGRYNFSGDMSVQAEVFYTVIPSKYQIGATVNRSVFQAISVPIYFRYDYPLGSSLGVYGMVGPRMDFYLDKYSTKTTLGGSSVKTEGSMKQSQLRTFQFGVAVGAGVKIPAGPGLFDVGATFFTSFLSKDSNAVSQANRVKVAPWGIELQLGYGFSL